MASPCPDGSTECLLQAILDANSGYNWDEVTFVFTAIFTIIAVVVSVFALFQSFVAAGPGRLKASERAIGVQQHRQRADTQFSWKEFRFRTIVHVPVIDVSKILEHQPAVISMPSAKFDERTQPTTKKRVVAGWSQLLNDLSLTDVNFNTLECLTDYVPDDVPAAPAWARVESIVLLCIMKGCIQLSEDDDGFIWCTGPSSQLSWTIHPTLGAMAVYRSWDIKDSFNHNLHEVQGMIPVFRGELHLSNTKIFMPLPNKRVDVPIYFNFHRVYELASSGWKQCTHQHDNCLDRKRDLWAIYLGAKSKEGDVEKRTAALSTALVADRPSRAKAFPARLANFHPALKKIYDDYFPWLILADDLDDNILHRLAGESYVEFDARDARVVAPDFDHLDYVSWLVGASGQQSTKSESTTGITRPALFPPERLPSSRLTKNNRKSVAREDIQSSQLRISRDAVRLVSRWLSDETYFSTATLPELLEARNWLGYQLCEVDHFLWSAGNDAICAAGNLMAVGSLAFGTLQFTTLSRRFVMPETLDAFNLQWTVDPNDEGNIIVKGYLDRETTQRLFSYSRSFMQKHHQEIHKVKCPQAAQGYFLAMDKSNSRWTTKLKPRRRSGSRSGLQTTTTGSTRDDTVVEETAEEGLERSSSDDYSGTTQYQGASEKPEIESDIKPETSPLDLLGDTGLRDYLLQDQERRASRDEGGTPKIDEHVAALEALVFFRACCFSALLASGSDTSSILTSDKRYQLVQVQ